MKNFLLKFLAAYDYKSFEEFLLSLFPTFKYQLQGFMAAVAMISGLVNYLFGIGPMLAIAMVLVVVVEIWTGLEASRKLEKKFESFRFSRCWLKIAIWLFILYVIHSFELDFENPENFTQEMGLVFFNFVFVAVLTAFLVENVTSILENYSVMQGQPKTKLIDALKGGWDRLIEVMKGKIK